MPTFLSEHRASRIRAILLFALILGMCTLFLGDIGVHNDDYIYNLRDSASGSVHELTFNRPLHVWRPVTRRVFPPLVTLLWPHPWLLHAIDALLHAAVTAAAYALLRRLHVRPGIAGPCALAFMVYPGHFEAVLWISDTPTLVSMLLVLASWHLYLWWLTRSHTAAVPLRLGALVAFGCFAWCAAALNEQPAGALASLPFAAFAVGLASGSSPVRRLVRTALPIVTTVLGLGLYFHGFIRHTPGFKGAYVVHHGTFERLWELAQAIPRHSILPNFIGGAWRQGIEAIAEHPGRALTLVLALTGLALPWCWQGSRESASMQQPARARGLALVLIGLVWAAAVWLPVAVAHSLPLSRLYYPWALGVAIAGAGIASLVEDRRPFHSRWLARSLRLGFAGAACAAVVVWIGVQDGYQRRYHADVAEAEPLARVFQQTIEPGSLFIPVHLSSQPTHTGVPGFDRFFPSTWVWPLAAGWNLRLALHNPDVHALRSGCGAAGDGLALNPREPARSVVCASFMAEPKPAKAAQLFPRSSDAPGRVFNLDRIVLFDIDGAGNTLVYTRVRIHPAGGDVIEIIPRQVALSPVAAMLPERILDVYPTPKPPELAPQR